MTKHSKKQTDIELVPDAWPRFEKFITEIVKAGPQHKAASATRKDVPAQSKKPRKPSDGAE